LKYGTLFFVKWLEVENVHANLFPVSMVTMLFVKCLCHSRSLVVISEQPMRLILVVFFLFIKKPKSNLMILQVWSLWVNLLPVLLFHITMIISTCYLENGIKVKDHSRPWPLTHRLLSHKHLFYFYLTFILLMFPSFDGNNVDRQMSMSF
jgi:hypothetical protein